MVNYTQTTIDKIVIHKIGKKAESEGFELSESELEIDSEETKEILFSFFLNPFKALDMYQFDLTSATQEDSVMNSVSRIFDMPQEFYVQSANLAEKLYNASTNEDTLPGELYVVFFRNCEIDEQLVNAIGIFKSEHKDTFIRVFQSGENFNVDYDNGINIKKLDKGCLIFNTDRETGFSMKIIDNTKATGEPYWTDTFLHVKKIEDNYFKTNSFLQICKDFTENVLTEKNNVEKNEQIGFMTSSYNYFKNNDFYDEVDFKKTVIKQPEIIEAFDDFKQNFEQTYEISPQSEFEISQDAVKKSKKFVRSIIKLDKNFHIYVHSKPDYIEKGFDDSRKLKYYKVFFEEES